MGLEDEFVDMNDDDDDGSQAEAAAAARKAGLSGSSSVNRCIGTQYVYVYR